MTASFSHRIRFLPLALWLFTTAATSLGGESAPSAVNPSLEIQPPAAASAWQAWGELARKRFQPATDEELRGERADINKDLARLTVALDRMPAGNVWVQRMDLDNLAKQLRAERPAVAALEEDYRRVSVSAPAAIEPEIAALRKDIRLYTDRLRLYDDPQAATKFASHINRLVEALTRGGSLAGTSDFAPERESFAWLARTHLIGDLLTPVRAAISHPNQILRVERTYFDELARDPITHNVSLNQSTRGARILGQGTVRAQPNVEFRPNAERGDVTIHIHGQGGVSLVARKQPATLHAFNRLQFSAEQPLLVTEHGIEHRPPTVRVASQTSLCDLNLAIRGRLLKRLATPVVRRIAARKLSQANPQTARKLKREIETEVAREGQDLINEVNELIEGLFWQTLAAREVEPHLQVSTTTSELARIGEFMAPWQLGADSDPPPSTGPTSQIQVSLHESSFNNTAAVAADKRVDEDVFREIVFEHMRLAPEDVEPDEIPAAFTFATADPFEVHFHHDRLEITLRIASFEFNNRVYHGQVRTAHATYRTQPNSKGATFFRQGEIQIEPTDGPDQTELAVCLARFLVPKASARWSEPNSPGSSFFQLTHLALDRGWLFVGLDHPDADAE